MFALKTPLFIFAGMLLCGVLAEARDVFTARLAEAETGPYGFNRDRKAADWEPELDCPVHKLEPVHTIMDRVCFMCHEMFSSPESTLRFECRKNCFDNTVFRKCLGMFTAPEPAKKA